MYGTLCAIQSTLKNTIHIFLYRHERIVREFTSHIRMDDLQKLIVTNRFMICQQLLLVFFPLHSHAYWFTTAVRFYGGFANQQRLILCRKSSNCIHFDGIKITQWNANFFSVVCDRYIELLRTNGLTWCVKNRLLNLG